jgi:hypothetical protein
MSSSLKIGQSLLNRRTRMARGRFIRQRKFPIQSTFYVCRTLPIRQESIEVCLTSKNLSLDYYMNLSTYLANLSSALTIRLKSKEIERPNKDFPLSYKPGLRPICCIRWQRTPVKQLIEVGQARAQARAWARARAFYYIRPKSGLFHLCSKAWTQAQIKPNLFNKCVKPEPEVW